LRLDRGRLTGIDAGRTKQRPQAVASSQWADNAFDTGNQAQALAIQTERVRHDGDPRARLRAAILDEWAANLFIPKSCG
jgi:hypothetical protein